MSAVNASLPAIQASATQLQLEPHSDVAKKNAVFYRQQHGVTRKDFIPRELDNDFLAYPPANMPQTEEWEWQEWNKPEIVRFTTDPDRMLADNVLSQDQCDKLLELAKYCKEGDGYQRKAPHTYNELFEELNILDAAKKSQEGEVVPELSQLYINASRRSRDAIAKEFNLQTPLYFSYTHLVCRTAKHVVERRDLSHHVHSDNCILNEATGDCDKVPPAYTWRDYSAIMYLNDEFEGGDFFYAHSTKDLSPEETVSPKCGRLVAFSAGKENMHGVLAVTKGRRCAVALWFTLDPNHKEATFSMAEEILHEIKTVS
ncbi:Prolyl 3-hydroxylase 1 [Geodia barretti]|uniref:procollagen-proline 3-dioxygenase n=1 Tax=Geodia barretti TaxID=519541 RepID=A0AA35WVJ1_GEOBA|nr:Prolyl 3-hydroxylase 1 [Geodia barretti]